MEGQVRKKNEVSVLLWNIAGGRKLFQDENRRYIEESDIVVIQETWIEKERESGDVSKLSKKFKWWAKAALKEKNGGKVKRGRASGGQLIGVRRCMVDSVSKVKEWEYGMLLVLKEEEGEEIKIVTVYNNVGVGKVCEKLKKVLENINENGGVIYIIGDWNARVGNECGYEEEIILSGMYEKRISEDEVINSEGRKLTDFCKEYGLCIMNGKIKGDRPGKLTFIGDSMKGKGSVIDLVLSATDIASERLYSISVESRADSDHLPIKISFRIGNKDLIDKKVERMNECKIEKYTWKSEKFEKYQKNFDQRLKERKKEGEWEWEELINTVKEVAVKCGMKSKNKGERKACEWYNEECKVKRREVHQRLDTFRKTECMDDKKTYLECKKEYKVMCNKIKDEWKEKKWNELNESKDMSEWWKGVNYFRNKKRILASEEIEKDEWKNYFEKLIGGEEEVREIEYNSSESEEDDENEVREEEAVRLNERVTEHIMNGEIGEEEMKRALKKMKKGKAPGEDGIQLEFLYAMTSEGREELRKIFNKIWEQGVIPKEWETALIYPIFKEGDMNETSNYRGVSFLNAGYKLMTNIITRRMNDWLEKRKKIKENQAGFRSERGTMDHIFVLNSIIGEKLKNRGGKINIAFIDFRKAFDTVDRDLLFKKIEKLGIKGKMLEFIKGIYRVTKCKVIAGKELTEEFIAFKGVRQGCAMSAMLFNIFIDDMDKMWEERNIGGTVIGNKKIFALKYADDVAILADHVEGLKEMLKKLEKYVDENKLQVNVGKTKIMRCTNGRKEKIKWKWNFKGDIIEEVNSFKYLGCWFTSKGAWDKQSKFLAARAWRMANTAWGVIKRAGRNTIRKRVYLYETLAETALMYGVEVWGWGDRINVDRARARMIKMALNVAKNTHEYVWSKEARVETSKGKRTRRALKYIGKIIGMNDERLPKICLKEECRNILNNNETRWGKEFKEMLKEMECMEAIDMIRSGAVWEDVMLCMEDGFRRWKLKEDLKINECIMESSYAKLYKFVETGEIEERYWGEKEAKIKDKECWARMRCGNIGRAFKKGYMKGGETHWDCRLCGYEWETLEHILVCTSVRTECSERIGKRMDELFIGVTDVDMTREVANMLREKPIEEVCEWVRGFERLTGTERGE